MAEIEQPDRPTHPFVACCLCSNLLRDAMQLVCLHNCCRQCFITTASQSSSQGVACVLCGTVTQVGDEQPNGFIEGQVQCYSLNADSGMCGVCTGNGAQDRPPVLWCLTCRHSFCKDCATKHLVSDPQHTVLFLEELKGLNELYSLATAKTCAIHKNPLDFACLNCETLKCSSCWPKCKESKHEMHIVGEESFDSYIDNLVTRITTVEKALLRKSEVLKKPRSFPWFTQEARFRHLRNLHWRKRRIIDAVTTAYEKIESDTKDAYDDLKVQDDEVAATADRIASQLSDARNYICRLIDFNDKCEIFKQQKIVRERLNVLSGELDIWSERLTTTMREVKIESSLPENVEEIVGSWIGKPQVYSASSSLLQRLQLQQCFSFGTASVSVQLPVDGWDVAMTKNGHSLLLAAEEHGLIEFSSSSGRELSRWQPPDKVQAVAALSDGRAAVSLYDTQCVALLKRKDNTRRENSDGKAAVSSWWQQQVMAAGDDAWTEQLRVQLPWSPDWLSAHGDVLAVSEFADHRLQLLSLSSGQLLMRTERHRDYEIGSLAVTSRAVVTGSSHKVALGLGRRAAYVLDAHNLADDGNDEPLWRHVPSSSDRDAKDEELQGICADSSGGCLYAAVWRSDKSSGRVSALSLADGSEVRRFALRFSSSAAPFQPLLLPVRLSLSDDAIVNSSRRRVLLLAVLCWDSQTNEWRTVLRSCTSEVDECLETAQ